MRYDIPLGTHALFKFSQAVSRRSTRIVFTTVRMTSRRGDMKMCLVDVFYSRLRQFVVIFVWAVFTANPIVGVEFT